MGLPVIIDTDPGVDDALALLLAGASPELDVLAITIVAGNVGLDVATENARRIVPLAWRHRPAPPIYRGFAGGKETAEFVHGWDGLGGAAALIDTDGALLYPALAPVSKVDAVSAILAAAERHPGEVSLITLGPLTNAARALAEHPETFRKLRRIVIMGGAFRETGNATPVAEFNIFADPAAAHQVCNSRVPLLWVPVDATHSCLMRESDLDSLPDSRAARFMRAITAFYMEHHLQGFGERACILHDPLPIALALWPDLIRRRESHRVDVEVSGDLTAGMTIADFRPEGHFPRREPNGEICFEVDASLFSRRMMDRFRELCAH